MRLRYMLVITAPILATSVLLLLVGATGAWYVQLINKDVSIQLARNLECTLAGEQAVLDLRDLRHQLQRFLDTGDEEDLQAAMLFEEKTALDLRNAYDSATTDDLRELAAGAMRSQEQFFGKFKAVLQDPSSADKRQPVRVLVASIWDTVIAPAQNLLNHARQAATEHSERSRMLADRIGLGLVLLGACGSVAGLMAGFGIARGIAHRIESSEREAARSEQLAAVGQLAAGLAHELRNPLMAMRVLVEAGVDAKSGGLDQRDLEVIDEEIERLDKLVASFLEFARPPQLEKSSIDVATLVDPTLNLIGGAARLRGTKIEWNRPDHAVIVNADPVQMRQVILNLLLNALDATGDDGVIKIEIRDGSSDDDGDAFLDSALGHEIIVSDNGPGVPDHMKEKIFQPFVSGRETGMGLGLAVSRRIVEAHGGRLSISDNADRGARFTIRLPVAARGLHLTEGTHGVGRHPGEVQAATGGQETHA